MADNEKTPGESGETFDIQELDEQDLEGVAGGSTNAGCQNDGCPGSENTAGCTNKSCGVGAEEPILS